MTTTPERLLVVTPYAPYRDGIAAYALQHVRALRAQGNHVEVLSPVPTAAHHHLDLQDPREVLRLPAIAKSFDRVIMHFHPDYFLPQPATFTVRLTRFTALAAAVRRCPPTTLIVHEIDERWGTATDLSATAARAWLGAYDKIEVHYRHQADQIADAFHVPRSRIELIPHGIHFRAKTRVDRATARTRLGIADDAFVFLCIGFVAHHKGFDRAVRALGRLDLIGEAAQRVRLDVVGAPSMGNEAAAVYADELESLVAATPGAIQHRGYVSDSAFDEWLLACDVVLLPYRHIWSSSVVERAALFGPKIIATSVGGLEEQLASITGARTVEDDRGLASAMAEVLNEAGLTDTAGVASDDEPWEVEPTGPAVLEEVRRRADANRGYRFRRPVSGAVTGTKAKRGAASASSGSGVLHADARAVAALRRVGPLSRPVPVSARPGVGLVKQIQRRLFNWEIEPIIGWVDELRRATQQVVESGVEDDSVGQDKPPSS